MQLPFPGLLKIEKKRVEAKPGQKGVPNPFKPGELMDRAAKPAYNKVKVRALKTLKEMASNRKCPGNEPGHFYFPTNHDPVQAMTKFTDQRSRLTASMLKKSGKKP